MRSRAVEPELQRSPEQVREHYEIEKVLAAQLREGSVDERKQLTRKVSPDETEPLIRQQLRLLARFIGEDTTDLEVGPGDCALIL